MYIYRFLNHALALCLMCTGVRYRKASIDNFCPESDLIDLKGECIMAAAQLGLEYKGQEWKINQTVGCYNVDGSKDVFFNSRISSVYRLDHLSQLMEELKNTSIYSTVGICKLGINIYQNIFR